MTETNPGGQVADINRIRLEYADRLRRLAAELAADLDAGPVEREQINLLNNMFCALLDTYATHTGARGPTLDVSTSVMYAMTQQMSPRVLSVPLRSLVEYNTLSPWQARLLNSMLGGKRTLMFTGPQQSGKSTLLNSLIHLLPNDLQMVAIEEGPELPALHDRAFTLTLTAKPGSPAMAAVLERAAATAPSCVVAGKLATADVPAFLRSIPSGAFGLATLDTPAPEVGLAEWMEVGKDAPALLARVRPLLVHMERDQAGRPRLMRIVEVRQQAGSIGLAELKQG
ncbi:MAG: Flp pilus assembly complex ATPase component TadA [Actinobacteria bacterium]|nr:Flp pilus assembly complex ATPase component TadA [Actinomycetota bacterium]